MIHSTFDHLSTGTGRLSSRDPNVQNMPVFGKWARGSGTALCHPEKEDLCRGRLFPDRTEGACHLSGEDAAESFLGGRDVHMETPHGYSDFLPKR
jgi:DNA polymerase-1